MMRFLVLAAFALTACSGPLEAGDPCTPEGGVSCSNSTLALTCEGGIARAIECRGPAGCIADGEKAACDFSKARAGDSCPKANENQGQCDAGNPNQLLRCTSGTWKAETGTSGQSSSTRPAP